MTTINYILKHAPENACRAEAGCDICRLRDTIQTQMTPALREAMVAFSTQQDNLARYGAHDTEPETEFHAIVHHALHGLAIRWGLMGKHTWQLYTSMAGADAAALALTIAAEGVYKAIAAGVSAADRVILQALCWRLDLSNPEPVALHAPEVTPFTLPTAKPAPTGGPTPADEGAAAVAADDAVFRRKRGTTDVFLVREGVATYVAEFEREGDAREYAEWRAARSRFDFAVAVPGQPRRMYDSRKRCQCPLCGFAATYNDAYHAMVRDDGKFTPHDYRCECGAILAPDWEFAAERQVAELIARPGKAGAAK